MLSSVNTGLFCWNFSTPKLLLYMSESIHFSSYDVDGCVVMSPNIEYTVESKIVEISLYEAGLLEAIKTLLPQKYYEITHECLGLLKTVKGCIHREIDHLIGEIDEETKDEIIKLQDKNKSKGFLQSLYVNNGFVEQLNSQNSVFITNNTYDNIKRYNHYLDFVQGTPVYSAHDMSESKPKPDVFFLAIANRVLELGQQNNFNVDATFETVLNLRMIHYGDSIAQDGEMVSNVNKVISGQRISFESLKKIISLSKTKNSNQRKFLFQVLRKVKEPFETKEPLPQLDYGYIGEESFESTKNQVPTTVYANPDFTKVESQSKINSKIRNRVFSEI